MKMIAPLALFTKRAAFTLMLITIVNFAFAQNRQRPNWPDPNWKMEPVGGPNLHYKTFASEVVGEEVSYLIYLPPGYYESAERFPVVYWMHGIGGSQRGVPRIAANFTQAIKDKKAPPLIMVYINGMVSSGWVDSFDGKTPVETVAIKELIPFIDEHYRTIASREGRMIEGFSMGGAGAARWGFKYPELFGSISIIDGALNPASPPQGRMALMFERAYGSNQEYYDQNNPWNLVEQNASSVAGRTPIRIVTGTKGLANANIRFHEHLKSQGIEAELYQVPDAPHSPNPMYEGIGDNNWKFYTQAFEAVSDPDKKADKMETSNVKSRDSYLDIDYTTNTHPQRKLDLFVPTDGTGPWPLVIWIHGGGWQGGTKKNCLPLRLGFTEKGFAIASIDYRLTGTAPFPAQIEDVKAAVRWLRHSASEYNLDPEQFVAWGSSAGGHLAALLGTSEGEESFEVGEYLDMSSSVDAVCDFYGPTEFISFVQTPGYESHAKPHSPESKLMGATVLERPDLAARLSPLTYVSPGDPPFLIIHGDSDPVVPLNQSEQLFEKLQAADVPALYRSIKGAKHGGPQFATEEIADIVKRFFEQSLAAVSQKTN